MIDSRTDMYEQAKIQGLLVFLVLLKPRHTCLLLILGKDSMLSQCLTYVCVIFGNERKQSE